MLGPLDAVIAHLAFDDPSSGAQPPSGQQLGADLPDRAGAIRGEIDVDRLPTGDTDLLFDLYAVLALIRGVDTTRRVNPEAGQRGPMARRCSRSRAFTP